LIKNIYTHREFYLPDLIRTIKKNKLKRITRESLKQESYSDFMIHSNIPQQIILIELYSATFRPK